MKKILFLISFIFSTSVFANGLDWFNLELYERYRLTQDIVFDNGVSFKAGSEFDMIDYIAEGIPVAYFQMHFTECMYVDQTAKLILVDVEQENPKKIVVGAELSEGCNLGVFVELKDFFTKSFFTDQII